VVIVVPNGDEPTPRVPELRALLTFQCGGRVVLVVVEDIEACGVTEYKTTMTRLR
jgi:hypothetical protein